MPKQVQYTAPQEFIPVFSSDIAGDPSYNSALEMIDRVPASSLVNPTTDPCQKEIDDLYNAKLAIYNKALEDAYNAYLDSIKSTFINFLLDLAGRGLWQLIQEIATKIWNETEAPCLTSNRAELPGFGPGEPGGGIFVDGVWYRTMGQKIPRPGRFIRVCGQNISEPLPPGRVPPEITNPGGPLEPTGPKPPQVPVGADKVTLAKWLSDNWRKIFGRIPIADLGALLSAIIQAALKYLTPTVGAFLLAALAAILVIIAQLRQIYNAEVDRIKVKIGELQSKYEEAKKCCANKKCCDNQDTCCNRSAPGGPNSTVTCVSLLYG